jgi:poly-gamma-glutamate synthesis protein (capsule biosynthesis protein)
MQMGKSKVSVVFTGDIGFDKYMDKKWKDENLLSDVVLDFFHSADHVVINVEGSLIESEKIALEGMFVHAMDPEAICVFNKINADVWNLANNHIMDVGIDGIKSTLFLAKQNGVKTIGAGVNVDEASRPVYFDGAGGIGIISVGYKPDCISATKSQAGCFSYDDYELIKTRIEEIKKTCRWCVIISHGGDEFAPMPLPYTRDRYLNYIEMGADVVVGHHPHVVENYELLGENKAIFYSLGNFIFDTDYQRAHAHTDEGVLLKLVFSEDKLEFLPLGIKINLRTERISECEVPDIFTNVSDLEYQKLSGLLARAFLSEERKKMIYLEPDRFDGVPDYVWDKYYHSSEPDGYEKNQHMDLEFVLNVINGDVEQKFKKSSLDKVKKYLTDLL